jgi:hypothetical protein
MIHRPFTRPLPFLLALFALFVGLTAARMQAQSLPLSNGTLSWTESTRTANCGAVATFNLTTYSGFSFLYGGTSYPLNGSAAYYGTSNYSGCPGPQPGQVSFSMSSFGSACYVYFTPEANGAGAAFTSGCTFPPIGTPGMAYAKYVVVGVTYAPPGVASDVQYTGTTSVGSTSTYSKSFTEGYSIGVSTTWGINIPSGTPTPTGGVTLTIGETNTSTQTQNSSTSVTLNKSTSVSYQTAGYPTTYSPTGTLAPALPDDYDTIQIWLNPELLFTAIPASGSNPATIQWNGYAYDPYDQAGPDVASIEVGCLNGHFTVSYCATQQGVLNRAWVVSEPIQQMSPVTQVAVTAAGCAPQTAESPSICPNTQDAYNILAADPLAYNPGGTPYTLFNSQPLPITTSDGRFTQISGANDPNPVQYEPGETETYNVTQMNTQMQSNGGSLKLEEKITISAKVNSGFFNIFNESTTYTNTDDFTQTSTWLNSLTTTQTVMDAFTIKGSTPPNYVPGEFIAYQDNLYGTFVLVPSN